MKAGVYSRWRVAVGVAAIGFGVAVPAAQAATVSVSGSETAPSGGTRTAVLTVDANGDGAAANQIAIAAIGTEGTTVRYRVGDAAGGLTPGAGCSGGGPAVDCLVPVSQPPSDCVNGQLCGDPGRAVTLAVKLGDGGDRLSMEGFRADTGGGPFAVEVEAAAGDDVIDTGDTIDSIDPDPVPTRFARGPVPTPPLRAPGSPMGRINSISAPTSTPRPTPRRPWR